MGKEPGTVSEIKRKPGGLFYPHQPGDKRREKPFENI